MTAKNTRALIFGISISILAFYFALRNVDFFALGESLLSTNPAWIILVLIAYMVHYWLKAIRWRDLLEPLKNLNTALVYPVMMTGFFANNLLPAHLGELVRMYVGSKVFKLSKTAVLSTQLLERMLDFTVIALIFGVALANDGTISSNLVYGGYVLIALTVTAWILVFLSLRFEQSVLRFSGWLLQPLPDRLAQRVLYVMAMVLGAMYSMRSTRLVVRSVILSLLQWALAGLAIYASMKSIGISIEIPAICMTLTATVLAVSLPAAPGFFGTVQLAFVLALKPYGVSESGALAGSIIFHIISYAYVMVTGTIVLNQLNIRVRDLQQGAQGD